MYKHDTSVTEQLYKSRHKQGQTKAKTVMSGYNYDKQNNSNSSKIHKANLGQAAGQFSSIRVGH